VTTQIKIAWALASAGACCGVAAAAYQGGWFGGLTAASAALTSLASVLGWTGKP